MVARLSQLVARYWPWVLAAWVAAAWGARGASLSGEPWSRQGRPLYLPAATPATTADRWWREAFPNAPTGSDIVLVVARSDRPFEPADWRLADSLAARFHHRLAVSAWHRAWRWRSLDPDSLAASAELAIATAAFEETVQLDDRSPEAWHNFGAFQLETGDLSESARCQDVVRFLAPSWSVPAARMIEPALPDLPVREIWDRHHPVFGSKFKSPDKRAVIILLRLAPDFLAAENVEILKAIAAEVDRFRRTSREPLDPAISIGISGSAAVGADVLDSAAESVRQVEILTVLVLGCGLVVVARSFTGVLIPLLVAELCFGIVTGLLVALASWSEFAWGDTWQFRIGGLVRTLLSPVVFGLVVPGCYFSLGRDPSGAAVGLLASGASGVCAAGLLMTATIAEYAPFRDLGVALCIATAVASLALCTLGPAASQALRCAWPDREWTVVPERLLNTANPQPSTTDRPSVADFDGLEVDRTQTRARGAELTRSESTGIADAPRASLASGFWDRFSEYFVRRPGWIGLLLLCAIPWVVQGAWTAEGVSFDLLSSIPDWRVSSQGNALLRQHFPVGEAAPLVVFAHRSGAGFQSADHRTAALGMAGIYDLTTKLARVPGVQAVRSLAEPLGGPPKPIVLTSVAGRRKLILREHPQTRSFFLGQTGRFRDEAARFEIVLKSHPLSVESLATLRDVEAALVESRELLDSFWYRAEFRIVGATTSVRDLRDVTLRDWRQLSWYLLGAAGAVAWGILRRRVLAIGVAVGAVGMAIAALGVTDWLLASWTGKPRPLDWKTPYASLLILASLSAAAQIGYLLRIAAAQRVAGPLAGVRLAWKLWSGPDLVAGWLLAGGCASLLSGSSRGTADLGAVLAVGVLLDAAIIRGFSLPLLSAWDARFLHRATPKSAHESVARIPV